MPESFFDFLSQELLAIPGVGEIMEGLASYSQRHFARVDRLARSTYLLDYTLAAMKVNTLHTLHGCRTKTRVLNIA